MSAEHDRLEQAREQQQPWKKWGPYLSERQWGTVREDYSESGDAWNYFSHDEARSRAYRWGEDGLAGICDDRQLLCFALALWNGQDPILKERLFGLTNSEGNHGEDVKEYYFYLDSTPTHSYMKYLYKYPQAAYPVRRPGADQPEPAPPRDGVRAARYRGVRPEPLLRRRGGVRQGLSRGHPGPHHGPQPRPGGGDAPPSADALVPEHLVLGPERHRAPPASAASSGPGRGIPRRSSAGGSCYAENGPELLFTENETNIAAAGPGPQSHPLRQGRDPSLPGPRPGAGGESRADRHQGRGALPGRGQGQAERSRCGSVSPTPRGPIRRSAGAFGKTFDATLAARRKEADEFYATVIPPSLSADERERDAPGARRHAVVQAVLPLRRRPLAGGAGQQTPSAPAARRAGTRIGTTCRMPMSSRCRTNGSIPGTRRGTWPFTAWR